MMSGTVMICSSPFVKLVEHLLQSVHILWTFLIRFTTTNWNVSHWDLKWCPITNTCKPTRNLHFCPFYFEKWLKLNQVGEFSRNSSFQVLTDFSVRCRSGLWLGKLRFKLFFVALTGFGFRSMLCWRWTFVTGEDSNRKYSVNPKKKKKDKKPFIYFWWITKRICINNQ